MCCGRYYDDAMMQAEAQGWADAFNKRRPPKEVQFLTGAAACGTAAITAMRCRLLPPFPLHPILLPPLYLQRLLIEPPPLLLHAAFVCELIDRPGKPICNIEK